MLHFDTNALIALPVWARQGHPIIQRVTGGEPAAASSLVWYEFSVGPLANNEAAMAMAFLQRQILPLTLEDAELAATIFNEAGRRRVFKTDAVIAAVAIRAGAHFVTLNRADFEPFVELGLDLVDALP
ncbi:MAG: type II toxin-antitoxin system VapC family toxin [Wenzhouxiangella sp.]|nr:MAG: type II toxin-antitoxin system VapC family toxin [Wenzhouxiangella sp.]